MADKPTPATAPAVPVEVKPERLNFKSLILKNPNHFGTLPNLGGTVVQALSSDTTYEQLTCVGLNQGGLFGQSRLEAVFNIKRHNGYGTNACGAGTREYVRFFVQDGVNWTDLGRTATPVYDLQGSPLPVSYCVSVNFKEARKFCRAENVVNVRAILSWDFEPTPGDPNFTPVWGNVLNARVQVAPLIIFEKPIVDLISLGHLTVDAETLSELDTSQKLAAKAPPPLDFGALKQLYAKTDVPSHRFGFAEAQKLSAGPAHAAMPGAQVALTSKLLAGPELSDILKQLELLSGDTSFEELTCAGYNPQTRELEAVIAIKRNSGYSGSLCSPGSTEYVGFWAFYSGAWHLLGQAQVQVHDLAAVTPGHPVMYAVYRISNVPEFPCQNLSGIPLRAILSWQTPPTGPNFTPVWGNTLNTHIQPLIGGHVDPNEHVRLMRLGRVTISGINGQGLANPTGIAGDCNNANDSPFGGETIVEGDFLPRVDVFDPNTGLVLGGAKPIIYQVWVTRTDVASAPTQLANPFWIALFTPNNVNPISFQQTVTLPLAPVLGGMLGAKYYTYMESDTQAVNPRTLAVFEAGGLAEGDYLIEVRGFVFQGGNYLAIPVQSKSIHVYNGYPHLEQGTLIQRPEVAMTLTNMGDCGTTPVGTIIQGSYSVTDRFFSSVSIWLVPVSVNNIPQPAPPVVLSNQNAGNGVVVYNGANTNGVSGTFTLDTHGMTPCGYNIRLVAWDRALVSSSCSGHWNEEDIGFCLSPAKK